MQSERLIHLFFGFLFLAAIALFVGGFFLVWPVFSALVGHAVLGGVLAFSLFLFKFTVLAIHRYRTTVPRFYTRGLRCLSWFCRYGLGLVSSVAIGIFLLQHPSFGDRVAALVAELAGQGFALAVDPGMVVAAVSLGVVLGYEMLVAWVVEVLVAALGPEFLALRASGLERRMLALTTAREAEEEEARFRRNVDAIVRRAELTLRAADKVARDTTSL